MRKDRKYVFETLMYRDFERRESYYTDMAAEGWHLKKYGLCVTVFERGEPEPGRRYRLLPKKGTPDPQKRELFLAGGWKQVDAGGSWDIYYTDDRSAENCSRTESAIGAIWRILSEASCCGLSSFLLPASGWYMEICQRCCCLNRVPG